jgi:hypothetical protein
MRSRKRGRRKRRHGFSPAILSQPIRSGDRNVPDLGLAHSAELASRSGWLQPAGRMGFGRMTHGRFLKKPMIFASTNHPPAPWKVPLLGLPHSTELASRSGWLQPAVRMGFGKRIHGGFLEKPMIFAFTIHPPAPWKVPLLAAGALFGGFRASSAQTPPTTPCRPGFFLPRPPGLW